jgi:hypothetical protein
VYCASRALFVGVGSCGGHGITHTDERPYVTAVLGPLLIDRRLGLGDELAHSETDVLEYLVVFQGRTSRFTAFGVDGPPKVGEYIGVRHRRRDKHRQQ